MNDEFSASLSEELARLSPPPMGDLVGQAARRGRRIRRVRMIGGAAASVAAVATAAALLGGPSGSGSRHTAELAGPAAAVAVSVTPSPSDGTPAVPSPNGSAATGSPLPTSSAGGTPSAGPSAPTPPATAGGNPAPSDTGGMVPTTPVGLVAQVVNAMPGHPVMGQYAVAGPDANGPASAQVYLHGSRGTSMVRVFLAKGGPLDCSSGCQTDSQGHKYEVFHEAGNCIQSTVVTSQHPDGSLVSVQLSTCLAWDGSRNPASFEALTQDQAVQLATDPSIALTETAAQAAQATAKYGTLPSFG